MWYGEEWTRCKKSRPYSKPRLIGITTHRFASKVHEAAYDVAGAHRVLGQLRCTAGSAQQAARGLRAHHATDRGEALEKGTTTVLGQLRCTAVSAQQAARGLPAHRVTDRGEALEKGGTVMNQDPTETRLDQCTQRHLLPGH